MTFNPPVEQDGKQRPMDAGKSIAKQADDKAGNEAVRGLDAQNNQLRQQYEQEKRDRNLSLSEQLKNNGTVKMGIITRGFGQSLEITDGDKTVVKGRSTEEVAAAKTQEQAYQQRFGQSADTAIGQASNEFGTSANQTGKIYDYKLVQHDKGSFSLGLDYEEKPANTRPPLEKLGDFMQAAAHRAADPEGWKAWAQGEINKLEGIGAGLNEAKEETKTAVAAGWKAMTDGTVVEFLSQPNAINAPVFKTVANVFDAMGKDPNAVNKAFEALGHVVMKASEEYSNLPDYDKGKIIGKILFGMINPEGSTEGAEAAIKVVDQVATHVDKAVWDTINQTMKSIKEMAPDLAEQTKQSLYDYIKSKGLVGPELQYADIPKDFFDRLPQPPGGGKGDNYLAMSGKGKEGNEGLPERAEKSERKSTPERLAPSERFVSELKQAVETLSESETEFLAKRGIEIKPVRRLTDIKPGLDQKLAGIFDPSESTIYIPEEVWSKGQWRTNDDVMFEIRHEFGHAFNAKAHPLGDYISDRPAFREAFREDKSKLTAEQLDELRLSPNYKSVVEARDEVFSDMYAHSTGYESNNPYSKKMKAAFPSCLRYLSEEM